MVRLQAFREAGQLFVNAFRGLGKDFAAAVGAGIFIGLIVAAGVLGIYIFWPR